MVEGVRKSWIHFIFLILLGCEFKASPYTTNTPKIKRNETNLELIMQNEPNVGPNFKVAFISDTHNYYDKLEQAVKAINSNGPYAFVVVAGDITNHGLLEEYDEARTMLNKLNVPYLMAIGNHDLLSHGDKIFARMFGATDYSVVYKNVHFIFFNNNNWETSGVVPDKNFVESQLQASTSPFKILISHVSPEDKDRFSDDVAQEWRTLVTTFGVNYYLNGHDHNPKVTTFGTGLRITIGSPEKSSFYELEVTPGGITYKKIHF